MCCLINHVYMHSFRSIIEATGKLKQLSGNFPGGWGDLNSFSARWGGNLNKNFSKIQMPGGEVEASIWLVHKDEVKVWLVVYKKDVLNGCEFSRDKLGYITSLFFLSFFSSNGLLPCSLVFLSDHWKHWYACSWWRENWTDQRKTQHGGGRGALDSS